MSGREGEPLTIVVEHDGLRHSVLDWGGTGEPLVLLHPNGLGAGFFDPLARRLTDTYRVVGVDLRGHGGTDAPASRDGLAFATMAADVRAVLDALEIGEFCALGESLGGGVGLLVDAVRPGALRRIVLCEAIAFDSSAFARPAPSGAGTPGNTMAEMTRAGRARRRCRPLPDLAVPNAMADMTRARRAVWPDRATARASYASRPPFDVVAPEALDAYLRFGFVDRPDGQVELACAPETEARIYEVSAGPCGAAAAFAQLPAMRGRVVVYHGSGSNLPAEWFCAQADAAGVALRTVDGGHFFLQEDTRRAEALVREALA